MKNQDKITAGIAGYLIGDALGLPVSGMKKEEVLKYVGTVHDYITNPMHPFLFYIQKGQWGSNARLMLASLDSYLAHDSYDREDLRERMLEIAKRSKIDFVYSRWMGRTVFRALITGTPSPSASSTSVFRTIPIALLTPDLDKALADSADQSTITHISPLSVAGAVFIAHVLYHQLHTDQPMDVVLRKALTYIEGAYDVPELVERVKQALSGTVGSIEEARKVFGTGSRILDCIPLTSYICVNAGYDFEKAVLWGVNSLRDDTEEDTRQMAELPYILEYLECNGGAGEVVAGLAGSIIAARTGTEGIPQRFLDGVEGYAELKKKITQDLRI